MTPRKWWPVFALLAAVLFTSPTWAAPPLPSTGWFKESPGGPVLGADGRMHTATCSGYPGTDPAFSFWSRKGVSKDLVVFFDGGGACFDNVTCTFPVSPGVPAGLPQFFVPAIPPNADPANFDGIFALDDPANPVKDWSFVYIPYCTGDLHLGSATNQYFSAGHPTLPQPTGTPPGTPYTIHHRGFDNFMVVLDWIKKNVATPQRILVAGSSAGGYGAVANFAWIQETFPRAHSYVVADASQGVTTPAFDVGNPGRNAWNPILPPWVYGTDPSLLASPNLMRVAAAAYPRAKMSQFTTNFDAVQIEFYALLKTLFPPGGSCTNFAIDWNQQMLGTLGSYASTIDNYRFYVAQGSYHTILRSPAFYTESSPGIGFGRWVDAMLKSRGGTDGIGGGEWQDAACPTCLFSPPCGP